jgi:hypothetical protein
MTVLDILKCRGVFFFRMVLVTADFRHVIRLSAVMIQESDVWNWNPLGITDHQSAPQFALDMVVASQQNLNSDLTVLLPIAQSMETVRSLAKCSCVVVKKPNIVLRARPY